MNLPHGLQRMGLVLATALAVSLSGCREGTDALRVVTWNLRFDNPGDGPDAWPNRRDEVMAWIRAEDADLLAFQEALVSQVRELEETLPGYVRLGVGRDDGSEAGEFSPLFYRTDRFDIVEQGTWWLSERPDSVGSVGWDAALPRIATWARLRERGSGRSLVFVSTHFDHVGAIARFESARLLSGRLSGAPSDEPVILAGDFNFADTSDAWQALSRAGWTDAYVAAGRPAPRGTFTGFDPGTPEGERIDYVFVRGDAAVRAYRADSPMQGERRASDHRPVTVDLAW